MEVKARYSNVSHAGRNALPINSFPFFLKGNQLLCFIWVGLDKITKREPAVYAITASMESKYSCEIEIDFVNRVSFLEQITAELSRHSPSLLIKEHSTKKYRTPRVSSKRGNWPFNKQYTFISNPNS
jgi:hypothetical protein